MLAAAAVAALAAGAAPSVARAQDVFVSSSPVDAWVGDRGGLQASMDGAAPEFAPVDSAAAHAGLELKIGAANSPVSDPNRTIVAAPVKTTAGTTQLVTSKYSIGGITVTQRVYVDQNQPTLRL